MSVNCYHLSPRGNLVPRMTRTTIKAPDPNLYKGLGLEEVAKIEDLVRKFKEPVTAADQKLNKTVLGRPFIHN